MPEIPKNPKIPTFLVQLMNHSEIPEIPKMPEIHKILVGLDIAYWLKSSMMLIRTFLKFPKILKCQPA